MIEVELPDGSVAEFPDGTSNDTIKSALQKRFAPAQPQAGRHLSYEEGLLEMEKERLSGASGKAGAFGTGFIGDIPIIGPAMLGGVERAAAGIASMIDGEDYATNLDQGQRTVQTAQEQNPYSKMAGGVAGNVAAMAGLGGTAAGARAMGITGPSLLSRAGASMASSGAISGADTAVRGGTPEEIAGSAAIGGGIGGAIPIVGAGAKAALGAVADRVAPTINALRNPTQEAQRRVGMAMSRDASANPAMMLSQADETVAAANRVPLVNADRGGETTRALARSVANQNPEARALIENTASDRFGAQSQRAVDFVRRIAGGNADDLAFQETLRTAARNANAPAYRAAYSEPSAQQVYTGRIQQLMQSPTFRRAVDMVPKKSADRGAVSGAKEIGNPFTQNSQGQYVLRQSADGTLVAPSLEFWDHVQRNLRSLSDKAARSGDNTTASEIGALRTALNEDLDTAVPLFGSARKGAAAFFGAEDALDAGRQFANSPRGIPEATKAFQKFTAAEKRAFSTGYASELIDRVKASGDRTNVINSMFKSQAARESMELVFGPQKAREIEAYVRVEDIADRLRGAMGNSTTARQLVELGIGAGAGGAAGYGITGDWQGAMIGAAGPKTLQYLSRKGDAKVMESIAKLLTSDNPQALRVAAQQAARQPSYMKALESLGSALAIPARSGASIVAQ
ncbi:hypothetical protein KEM44_21155 [Sinorhizobium meliloti]|nr:hypothetical protein SMB554_07190 [Sinorhizobium meliloti]UTG98635.1 hypothetical protein KEM44_21155 [Sinorhizobium meliloti]